MGRSKVIGDNGRQWDGEEYLINRITWGMQILSNFVYFVQHILEVVLQWW